jgi:serine/threonine-protein kinase
VDITNGTRLGHYKILATLGAGGQGQVYKAIDTTLDRPAVIKVLSPEQTVRPSSLARFEREAKLASSLDHPNICTIHGLHESDGVRFIAMQYVEGRNVRELVGGRPLELTSALAIVIQVADALAAAHARGIIHRDIKAGNVMVMDSGKVKVLDFGLAKLLEPGADDLRSADPNLTELGVPYGTATYAAPEQARGGRVDHRADIFSTGILLYEVVTGTWPFKGASVIEVRYAVLHDVPRSLAQARGEESPAIERLQKIFDRATAKEPDARYQRIEEFRDDLRAVLRDIDPNASQDIHFTGGIASVPPRHHPRRTMLQSGKKVAAIAVAAILIPLLALGAYNLFRRDSPEAINSLAVLPFTNESGNPDAEYLSDGVTESLINSLSQLPSVKVRSRNAVFRYKGQQVEPRDVGRELDVRAVLTGRMEKRGEDLVVNVELIDTKDDSHLWGERYARKISDLATLHDELSRDITDKLRVRLTGEEKRQLAKNYSTNSEAYQLYLQGRYSWNKRTSEGLQKGIEYFTQAIEKDPAYAPAYSGLADCYWLLNVYNVGPATAYNLKASDAASRALALDETLAEAHASLASISYRYDWNWGEAERHFKRAIELSPDYPTAHQWYSALLAAKGRFDESNSEARRAHELEPFSLTINTDVGRHFYYSRKYEESLAAHRKSIEMDRNFARGYYESGYALAAMGRHAEAISEFQRALGLDRGALGALSGLGYAYAVAGQAKQARQVLEQLKALSAERYVSPYYFAVVHAGLGEKERALEYLEKAADERFNWLVFLNVEPQLDGLRKEPRFLALVKRVGVG